MIMQRLILHEYPLSSMSINTDTWAASTGQLVTKSMSPVQLIFECSRPKQIIIDQAVGSEHENEEYTAHRR
jgi:hypothetical protein